MIGRSGFGAVPCCAKLTGSTNNPLPCCPCVCVVGWCLCVCARCVFPICQVLPFVLRREKSEVLADLPPKIITEMVCDLTPEQRRLHNMWERGGEQGDRASVHHAEEGPRL